MRRRRLVLIAALVGLVALAGVPATAASWKFVVLDDSRAAGWDSSEGVAARTLGILAGAIADEPGVELVIFPGDMVSGQTNNVRRLNAMLDKFLAAMAPIYKKGIPVYAVRGNHEYNTGLLGGANARDPGAAPFRSHFAMPANGPAGETGLTYSFTHKNALFVGFDQYANRAATFNDGSFAPGSNHGQMMNKWVTEQINGSKSPLSFAFAHEMLIPSRKHPDCMANDPESRDALVHALAAHHGAYLCGHDHMYRRGFVTDGSGSPVTELVVGTAGAGNYDYTPFDMKASGYAGPVSFALQHVIGDSANPTFGYLLVTVNDDNTWSGEFKGFQYVNYASATDHSVTKFKTLDTFTPAPDSKVPSRAAPPATHDAPK